VLRAALLGRGLADLKDRDARHKPRLQGEDHLAQDTRIPGVQRAGIRLAAIVLPSQFQGDL